MHIYIHTHIHTQTRTHVYVYVCTSIYAPSTALLRAGNRIEKRKFLKKDRKKKYGILPPSTALLRAGNRNLGAPALAPVFNK